MQDHPVWNLNEPGDSDHSRGDTSGLTYTEQQCLHWSDENNEQNCIVRETDGWHRCDVEQNTQNIKSDGYWCAEPPPLTRGPGGDVLSNTPILLPVAAGGRQSATWAISGIAQPAFAKLPRRHLSHASPYHPSAPRAHSLPSAPLPFPHAVTMLPGSRYLALSHPLQR